jgi:tetratricopeptide (TPR) repeat protein
VPLDWARTRNNLGTALRTLGERESGATRLEEAVAACRDALQEWTRERVPLDWARTQNNLGNALRTLGERESGTTRLEEAVAAYRNALMERTRERVPLDWAMSTGNQGVALRLLAERHADLTMAELALTQITAAFETCRAAHHEPNAAYYEAQLPPARALVERLRKG